MIGAPTGVHSLTLGPYNSALPEPVRLMLKLYPSGGLLGYGYTIGEASLELGYSYIGLEERVKNQPVEWSRGLQLVEELCARCSQANTLAYVQAVESMAGLIVPTRAAYLRMILAEMERVASHLMNIADMLAAIGMGEIGAGLRDLRERALQATDEWTGARLQPGMITYGGITRNIDDGAQRAITLGARTVERSLRSQVTSIVNNREIAARLVKLGIIQPEEAEVGSLRGPVARASGLTLDIRRDFPTGAYEEEGTTVVVQRGGDAYSRLVVRLLECLESLRLVESALDDLPTGPVRSRTGILEVRGGSGVGRAEGPRGEVFCWVRGGAEGLTGLHLSAGSFPSLGILTGLLRGQHLDDLRILLLSLDICLACAER